jgi:hypothetical protein
MKTLKVGIASYEDMKARTLAIAKGDLKRKQESRRFGLPHPKVLPSCCQIATEHYSASSPTPSRNRFMPWRRRRAGHRAICHARYAPWSDTALCACTKAHVARLGRKSLIGMCGSK